MLEDYFPFSAAPLAALTPGLPAPVQPARRSRSLQPIVLLLFLLLPSQAVLGRQENDWHALTGLPGVGLEVAVETKAESEQPGLGWALRETAADMLLASGVPVLSRAAWQASAREAFLAIRVDAVDVSPCGGYAYDVSVQLREATPTVTTTWSASATGTTGLDNLTGETRQIVSDLVDRFSRDYRRANR